MLHHQAFTLTVEGQQPGRDPYRELALAVVVRALLDALSVQKTGKATKVSADRQRARVWLATPSDDLAMWCHLGGVPYERLLRVCQRRFGRIHGSE